jgi:hypothetical protein
VPTIRGNIEAEYSLKGNSGEYKITIPGNMDCDFVLPDSRDFIISQNGKKIEPGDMKVKLIPGENNIVISHRL